MFKKFKGQVRRERHQATTNQKTDGVNNCKMFCQRTAILCRSCVGRVLRCNESERGRFLSKMSRRIHPAFQTKSVVILECKYCERRICARGMRALLLADTKVELYSTDLPPDNSIQLIGTDYSTQNCECRIKDVACLGCGNVVGYHVTLPCQSCIRSCNNGHFWMFHSSAVHPVERLDQTGNQIMLWGSLPNSKEDNEMSDDDLMMEECFR